VVEVLLWGIVVVAFWITVAYVVYGLVLAVRKLVAAVSGRPMQVVFVNVPRGTRRVLTIVAGISSCITVATIVFVYYALSTWEL
jgi:hypothetical protein